MPAKKAAHMLLGVLAMENEIEIIFNGMKEKVPSGTTVADLIVQAGDNDKHLIVARITDVKLYVHFQPMF